MNLMVPAVSRNTLRETFILTGGVLWGVAAVYSQSHIIWLPLLLFSIVAWVKFARAHCAIATLIIIIFDEGLYRITTFGLGPRIVGDMALFLIFSVILANAPQIWRRVKNKHTISMAAILLFWLIIAVSIFFGSHIIFHQPLFYGFIPARKYLVFGIYFFLIGVGMTKNDIHLFLKYLAWWGGLLALLGIIDASMGGGVIFTEYHQIGSTREGATRLAVGTFNVCYSVIYSLVSISHSKHQLRISITYFLLLTFCLINLFFVTMTRSAIIGVTGTVILFVLTFSTRRLIKIILVLSIIIPAFILSTPLLENTTQFNQIKGIILSIEEESNRDEGNVEIRKQGALALLDVFLTKSPIVGVGLFSHNNYPNNPIFLLSTVYNYHLIDVNGIATLILFGIPGVTLLVVIVLKTFKDARGVKSLAAPNDKMLGQVIFLWLVYILATPTLGNLLVERTLVYTGIILYIQDHLLNRHRTSNA